MRDGNGHMLSADTSLSAEGALEGGKSQCSQELSLPVRGYWAWWESCAGICGAVCHEGHEGKVWNFVS